MKARPRSIVLDADSTLAGIEGIDWLAARRGPELGRRVEALTARCMAGELPLDAVYGTRLGWIAPTAVEVAHLAGVYQAATAPDTGRVVHALQAAGLRVVIVSGGLREALLPLARELGVADDDLHAVGIRFAPDGSYNGWEETSLLATQQGKPQVVAALGLPRPIVAVGDGATDLAIRDAGAADGFVAYTGFVRRDAVVARADAEAGSFAQLRDMLLA